MRKIYNIAILVSGSIHKSKHSCSQSTRLILNHRWPSKIWWFPRNKAVWEKGVQRTNVSFQRTAFRQWNAPSWNVQGPLNVPQHTQTTEEQFLKKSKWIETSGCGGTKMCHCGLFRKNVYNTLTLPFSHIEPSKVLVLLALLKACG